VFHNEHNRLDACLQGTYSIVENIYIFFDDVTFEVTSKATLQVSQAKKERERIP
jgi:hypothetical protein